MAEMKEHFNVDADHTGKLCFSGITNKWIWTIKCRRHFNQCPKEMSFGSATSSYAEARAKATKCPNECHDG